ncbi:MAG TPA: glycosyltransferase family 2 protein [Candidatus Angelobacter sp.]|nr:glycosyltransferase family 2 protein [Candidatus Angelobacter sp.]
MIWFYWISGLLLALIWFVPVLQAALHLHEIADITHPQWEPGKDAALPALSIVVPARNEEADLETALRSLLHLNYAGCEIVAVNDRSTDRTGEIMDRMAKEPGAAGRLRVLHVQELPPRWLGKAHAMWLGAQQSSGDWVLFTDADCVFHPDSMRRALHYATKTSVDHLVLFPTMLFRTLGERIMISFPNVMGNFAMRAWKFRDPRARDHIGVGAFNLMRRSAYVAIGTYEKLRMEIVDDIQLGAVVKKAGFRQDVVFGPGFVTLRWAAGALGVVRNLEKNLFAFLRFRVSLALAACCVLCFLCVWPFVGVALAPGWACAGFAVAVAMMASSYFMTSRYTRVAPILFVTCPIGALLFMLAVLRSAFVALRDGGVTWRGTKYPLAELRKKKTSP